MNKSIHDLPLVLIYSVFLEEDGDHGYVLLICIIGFVQICCEYCRLLLLESFAFRVHYCRNIFQQRKIQVTLLFPVYFRSFPSIRVPTYSGMPLFLENVQNH